MKREEELLQKIARLEQQLSEERERNAALERTLAAEREAALDQRFAIVENNLKLLELKESLESEQEKSAKLLRNILPERVIGELQTVGSSKPELFEHVTPFRVRLS